MAYVTMQLCNSSLHIHQRCTTCSRTAACDLR